MVNDCYRGKSIFITINSCMKKFSVIIAVLCLPFLSNAQKPVLNHIAVYVMNLKTSTAFYRDVIGLDTIPEPFHDGRHTWFSVGGGAHLHVISGAASAVPHEKNAHLCFSVPSVDAFVSRLNK